MGALEELAELLPTKAARWVALATPPIAGLAFAAPHFLSPLVPKSTQAEIVLAQISMLLLVGLVGSLTVLVLVLKFHHSKPVVPEKKKIRLPATPAPLVLQEEFRDLLISCIFQFPEIKAPAIAKALEQPIEFINYHLQELKSLGLIEPLYFSSGMGWAITQRGREYAIKFNVADFPPGGKA